MLDDCQQGMKQMVETQVIYSCENIKSTNYKEIVYETLLLTVSFTVHSQWNIQLIYSGTWLQIAEWTVSLKTYFFYSNGFISVLLSHFKNIAPQSKIGSMEMTC